ncbi:DUF397 domain-containing protein [Streptomyces olivoreticuli]
MEWQKSSYSGDRDDCIEVGRSGGRIAIRESDDPTVVVRTAPVELRALIAGVKAGRLL